MKISTLLLIATLLFLPKSLWAEKNDSITLNGRIVDSFTLDPLADVQITACDSLGNVVNESKSIDWIKLYNMEPNGDVLIEYFIAVPAPGKWTLRLRKEGYEDLDHTLTIPGRENGQKVTSLTIEDIGMNRKTRQLKEATVTASKIMMLMKGDTIVYNADAFQTAEGSLLDKLIEQLPGVKLENGGHISVNGEFVSSLLINGKDFFNGDAIVALRNLPAYLVDKVKVYHKAPEYAYLSKRDSLEQKEDPLVMDVGLKRDYHEQWIASLTAGYGTDERYRGKAFGMRYDDISRVTVYANANNLGDERQLSEDGTWSLDDLTTQPARLLNAGIDVFLQNKRTQAYLTGNVQSGTRSEDVLTATRSFNYLPMNNGYTSLSRNTAKNKSGYIDWNTYMVLPLKKLFMEAQAHVNYQQFKTTSDYLTATLYGEQNRDTANPDSIAARPDKYADLLISSYENLSRSKRTGLDMGLAVKGKFTSPLTGNLITLRADGTMSRARLKNYDYSSLTIADGTSSPLQKYTREPADASYFGAGMDYEMKAGRLKLTLSYDYTHDYNKRNRNLYQLSRYSEYASREMFGILPSTADSMLYALDAAQSYVFRETRNTHKAQAKFNYNIGTNLLSLTLPVNFQRRHASDTRATSYTMNSTLFNPSFTWLSPLGLQAVYRMKMTTPEAALLFDLTDDSDLQSVYKGNPGLKNERTHYWELSYNGTKPSHAQTYNATAIWTIEDRKIVNTSLLNPETGVYTLMPRNTHGNWNVLLSGDYGRALDQKQHFFLNIDAQSGVQNYESYTALASASETLGRTGSTSFHVQGNARLTWRLNKLLLNFKAGARFFTLTQNGNSQSNLAKGTDRTYNLGINYALPWDMHVESNLSLFAHSGYSSREMNKSNWVWNAALTKSLLKNSLSIRMESYDILKEINNYQRTASVNAWTETTRNSLSRYVMLSLVYRLPEKN